MTEGEDFARNTAADAIRFAHLAMEMLASLIPDMQASGALRPTTKSKMMELLREVPAHGSNAPAPDAYAVQRAAERALSLLRDEVPLEREAKRERPEKR